MEKYSAKNQDEVDSFIKQYEHGLERKYDQIKSAHPLHPQTGEPGTFIRFSRQYPIYRTRSGEEFIVQNGIPKLLRKM